MAKTERFTDLAEVEAERLRLNALCNHYGSRLEAHLEALRDKEIRTALLANSISGMVRGSGWGKLLGPLLGKSSVTSGLSMAMGAGKVGWGKRLGLFALGLAMPGLLKKLEGLSWAEIANELAVSLERTWGFIRKRREERQQG
ncbi:MAG: hypothetical protein JST38_20490 [Bacteroidetes bacterium]|nr:hypothetical protein [Bacteroidota bacterium]MBS1943248.1 hypothetical protein [Bacteroidota bacterium]